LLTSIFTAYKANRNYFLHINKTKMLSKFGTGAMQVLRFTFFKWNKASQSKVLAVRKKRVEEIQHESRAIRR